MGGIKINESFSLDKCSIGALKLSEEKVSLTGAKIMQSYHLLWGIVMEPDGFVGNILRPLGLHSHFLNTTFPQFYSSFNGILYDGKIGHSETVFNLFKYASSLSNNQLIRTEHIALGMTEPQIGGLAYSLLDRFGDAMGSNKYGGRFTSDLGKSLRNLF